MCIRTKNYYKELPYEWLDLYRKRLWDKYLPLAIEAIPLKMHLQILDQDRADSGNELDIDEYEISISNSEVQDSVLKLKAITAYENQLKKGDNIIFAAFGGGFTWGSIYLKWAY